MASRLQASVQAWLRCEQLLTTPVINHTRGARGIISRDHARAACFCEGTPHFRLLSSFQGRFRCRSCSVSASVTSPPFPQPLLDPATSRGSCWSPVLCRSCSFSPKSRWFPNASSKVSNYQAGGTENLTPWLMGSDVQAATYTKRCPRRTDSNFF